MKKKKKKKKKNRTSRTSALKSFYWRRLGLTFADLSGKCFSLTRLCPNIFIEFSHHNCHSCFYLLKLSIITANSVDPDEMQHSLVSDLDLHCLQMSLLYNARHKWVKQFLYKLHTAIKDLKLDVFQLILNLKTWPSVQIQIRRRRMRPLIRVCFKIV